MPTLQLKLGDQILDSFELKKGIQITIGRDPSNDIVIDTPGTSGRHAKIITPEGGYLLTDLQSKNGSYVNGELITSQALKHNDIVSIGTHTLLFQYGAHEEAGYQQGRPSDLPETAPPKKATPATADQTESLVDHAAAPLARGTLISLSKDASTIELSKRITKIGHEDKTDIRIDSVITGKTAAVIVRHRYGFYITPTGGFFKVKVNDRAVTQQTRLQHADVIKIGPAAFKFKAFAENESGGTPVPDPT